MRNSLLHSLLVASLLALSGASGSGAQNLYEVLNESRFWIDGSATTGPYSCVSETVHGSGNVIALRADQTTVRVEVPVGSFDCGIRRMNRDLRQALNEDQHPAITFSLRHAEVLADSPAPGKWVPVRAVGTITMAGSALLVAINAEGLQLDDGRVRIRGSHPLQMSDFGIDPPSGLLGLVRAHDRVTARFDIIASQR